MDGPSFHNTLRDALRSLARLSQRRAEAEQSSSESQRARRAALDRELKEAAESIEREFQREGTAAKREYAETEARILKQHEDDRQRVLQTHAEERDRLKAKAAANEQAARKALEESVWMTESVFEGNENRPRDQLEQFRKLLELQINRLDAIQDQAAVLMRRYRQQPVETSAPDLPDRKVNPQALADELGAITQQAEQHLLTLSRLAVPRLMQGAQPLALAILLIAVPTVTVWGLQQWQATQTVLVVAGASVAIAALIVVGLFFLGRAQTARAYSSLAESIAHGRAMRDLAMARACELSERQHSLLVETRDRELEQARTKFDPILPEIRQRLERRLQRVDEKLKSLLPEIDQRRDEELNQIKSRLESRLAVCTTCVQQQRQEHERDERARREVLEADIAAEWREVETEWKQGVAEACDTLQSLTKRCASTSISLANEAAVQSWQPPPQASPIVRFGEMRLDRAALPGGLPESPALQTDHPREFDLPAVLEFPDRCSLLIEAKEAGRARAVQTLQAVMFQLLATIPPGKARFTIFDPVGLGQNFAGFMHLADFDAAMVGERIWTETRHIEQKLADLTEHMENVIQKYLRNEFETIDQYNEQAGEIAEPFRFLVVADFPANFSDAAARRLMSVAASGARCGVYTLISVDSRQQLPQGIDLDDLRQHGVHLIMDGEQSRWRDDDFESLPLRLGSPPDSDTLTAAMKKIGRAGQDATRVEVPFEFVAPPDGEMWAGDCSAELRVPLGRAGATKLQQLRLGKGTAHHALIAGKTGSGKSTLLHVLITNLALWYSPDEVEFYLVDFKKGVEFKTYARHRMPHARAVAIESDREFGLSVLHRLDAELKDRGAKFRDLGVQDLAAFRRAAPDQPMPRTLLIVDEFQEFFVEDDKLAQDAALLLDRLVRQGRAFGIHVLLGSQTLGGAYSLARTTIGQMAVRIALQCSEADSYLILGEDNAAARLLSRPGEAIYNDASGNIEGNSPFQIVWLSDERRDAELDRVQERATTEARRPREKTIVFEGNVPAEIAHNDLLAALLDGSPRDMPVKQPRAWLGEAIAIKDPTAALFRRQSGNNLLIVGQRDESAMAMMAASLIGLAAQSPRRNHNDSEAQFIVLDGSQSDAPEAGVLPRVCESLPARVQLVDRRDVDDAIISLAELVEKRHAGEPADSPVCLFIYGLQRYRTLRAEDEFGFSMDDESKPPSAAKQFLTILRDGPGVGVHAIVWCDTMNNVTRMLDRQGLREFDMRVLFQMSATDSSNLIDSPAASRLGLKRAIFYSEDEGQLERFRPYALPDDEFLARVRAGMASRAGPGSD